MTTRPRSYDLPRHRQICAPPYQQMTFSPRSDHSMQNPDTVDRLHHTVSRTLFHLAVASSLLAGVIGCGSSATDPTPALDSHPTAIHSPRVGLQEAGQTLDRATTLDAASPERDEPGQRDRSSLDQPVQSAGNTNGGTPPETQTIPETIVKDLDSPNPSLRNRALDYWETNETPSTFDPVFDAMEDEDPAVRAKATAIIEQHWAAEEQREKG